MAKRSLRDRMVRLEHLWCSPDRYVDALLEVRSHEDEVLFRVGGAWDRHRKAYVDRPAVPHVVRLQRSQSDMGRAIGRYLTGRLAGDDQRARVLLAMGNRGGGKTWVCALAVVAVALAVPCSWQFACNITSKQRREVLAAIGMIAPARWITSTVDDPRDARTEFLTGSVVGWLTAKNPAALRQAGLPIENILINEGQDQPQQVFTNAISAIRNTGGLVTIASNPPQREFGDWVALLDQAIQAEEVRAERFLLEAVHNAAINQAAVPEIAAFLRAVDQAAYDADALGTVKLAGDLGYPAFSRLPLSKGGNIGDPEPDWRDVTAELSAEATYSSTGFEWVAGADFQRTPGSCAVVGKLYRVGFGDEAKVVLWIRDFITTNGTERDLSQAFISAGYNPGQVDLDGRPAPGRSLLLVGDATGARQDAEHRRGNPYSFVQLRSDGWVVIPPMHHWKNRTPWNPEVRDSRKQMHASFVNGLILISPRCADASPGFPSLVESLARTKVHSDGSFVRRGHFTHGPDGLRYLAWKFLPRSKPAPVSTAPDMETFNQLRGVKLWSRDGLW